MTKTKRGTSKRSEKHNNKELKKEIILVVIIGLSILSIVSLHSDSPGFIGKILRNNLLALVGFGGYILPYLILIMSTLYIMKKANFHKRLFSIATIYLGLLIVLDITLFPLTQKSSFLERANLAISSGKNGFGGGLLGSIFSYIFLTMFGSTGSYVIIFFIILLSILVLTDTSLAKFLRTFFIGTRKIISSIASIVKELSTGDFSKNKKPKIFNHNNDLEETSASGDIAATDSKKLNSNEFEEKIKILDYTQNGDSIKENNKLNTNTKDKINEEDQNSISIINTVNENYENYKFPTLDMLKERAVKGNNNEEELVLSNANKLIETLSNFGIEAKVIQASIGPSITRYELQPAPGVKVSRIVSLSNDIALSLASSDLRIEAPIPGKSAIGIEIPNKYKVSVNLREILESKEYQQVESKIPIALGKDIAGKPIIANIEKMPHLLIAGATGSGKSVCINTLISSILYKSRPDEVKLLMIDPKVVELSVYNGIPHLLIPVVTDPKKAANALNWAVQEMTKRYNLFAKTGVRDMASYNNKVEDKIEKLPQLVIIIDELADLMMVCASEVEDYICRLAQMARAAGIHLIVATQRPSVDVITGTIKANIPSRISFAVSSQADSRTILDMGGAEKLLGKGDMLFYPVGESKPLRIQGAYIGEDEVEKIVGFLKDQGNAEYKEEVIDEIEKEVNLSSDDTDDLLSDAIEMVVREGQASISLLQRRLKVGYARAARMIDEMEARGIVGGYEGSKPRKVLIEKGDLE
ncbi:DNA translocase FtsK [Gottschalkia purinilytica]|uniref:DNA translocase FtsK n=1 Tax=Gottschalkia purinilytica TaxID=1503 RepID=A0A0L0WBK7_GOTPU|nr:DNA translocase FtsK [Gottschalkia purinilytica]KNF08878.1 DNA translocase FtsK [Gottschalkia purinilytica]